MQATQQTASVSMIQHGQEIFNRPPRIIEAPPQDTLEIPKPPKKTALPTGSGWFSILLPLISIGIVFAIYILMDHASTTQVTFLLPMAIFAIISPMSAIFTTRQRIKAVRRQNASNEQKYRQALTKIQEHLVEQHEEQRRVALLTDPDPERLEQYIEERSHLWERRPEDADFLAVRVGKGMRPFAVTMSFPEVDFEDEMADELRQLKARFNTVTDLPCSISLPRVKSLGITGRRQDVAALSREILCQIATLHSPEDVRLLGIYPASQRKDWDWLRDLPHTAPLKGWKRERLTAMGEDDANGLLNLMLEELSQRASKCAEQAASPSPTATQSIQPINLPHLVVIVHDYVEIRKHPALTHAFKLGEQLGVSVIYLVAQQQAIPGECRGVVRLSDEGQLSYVMTGTTGEMLEHVSADLIELAHAQRISHSLSKIHIAREDDDVVDLPTNVRLLDLLELPFADQFDPEQWWGNGSMPRFGRLRVPIGLGIDGPVWLDLNESAHGPHGIIAGTTGAGKSELLQSLIVGLAVTHHPHLVNFVLVDFKGGAAFKPFEHLPHTVGMVTDLSGKLTERALVALKSELRRREHMLSRANAKKIAEYQAMRMQNPQVYEPLPNLFIIIDEFAELAKEHPTFMEGLVSVVQKGRSLGVHLILATQKPTGSVNPNIWSNLKFRICLRVASLQDSRDMLGRSEAALLPNAIPGRAYFQIGAEIFALFQSARTSLRARVANEAIFSIKQDSMGAGEITDQKILMDALEPYQQMLSAQLFKPWPAPLPQRISLNEVYRLVNQMQPLPTGRSKQPPYGWLTCPIGMIDQPAEQRQVPWLLNMAAHGGHMLIAGASGTGKSTFLRTLIASLVRTHAPTQLHLYLVDFGGQALRIFEPLPHVGGVFSETDDEYIVRLLRKLIGVIDERKRLCTTQQIDDFLAYQRKRGEDSTLPAMPATVLVIDKFIEFKQAHEREMDLLLSIARHGRTYGVYLVITADRPISIPLQLLSLIETRIGLRLIEITDSLVLLGKYDAAHIDGALPGRGYKRGKNLEEVHIALPTSGEDDDEQTCLLDEMVTSYVKLGKVPLILHAPPIRLLPEHVRFDHFLMEAITNTRDEQQDKKNRQVLNLRLGIEDFSLRPIALELNAETPHALVAGGPGSGRTGVLHTCLLMLASPEYRHIQVILVDLRRSSRLLRRLPNVCYVDTEERLSEAVDALKKELRRRVLQLREEAERLQDEIDEEAGAEMAPLVLMIDDYDQVNALTRNPLNELKEFMLKARDIHFHVVIAGLPGDLIRSDPLLQQVRAARLGMVLGGDPTEQPVLSVRLSDLPAGRGYLVKRHQKYLVQVAYLEAQAMAPWIMRLAQAHGMVVQKMIATTPINSDEISTLQDLTST